MERWPPPPSSRRPRGAPRHLRPARAVACSTRNAPGDAGRIRGLSSGEYEAPSPRSPRRSASGAPRFGRAPGRAASFLRYQLDELEKADAKAGEDEALAQERRVLPPPKSCAAGRGGGGAASLGRRSGGVAASRACKRLDDSRIDPSLLPVARGARGCAELDEAGRTLARYAGRAGGDPQRLETIDERLSSSAALAQARGTLAARCSGARR